MIKINLIPPPPTPFHIVADDKTFTLQARALTIRDAYFVSEMGAEFTRREVPDNHPARHIASVLPQFNADGRNKIMSLVGLPEMEGEDVSSYCDTGEKLAGILPVGAVAEFAKLFFVLQEASMPEKSSEGATPVSAGKKLWAILLTALLYASCGYIAYHLVKYFV